MPVLGSECVKEQYGWRMTGSPETIQLGERKSKMFGKIAGEELVTRMIIHKDLTRPLNTKSSIGL